MDEISPQAISNNLQPATRVLGSLPRATLSAAQLIEIRNGRPILEAWLTRPDKSTGSPPERAALDASGRLAAILYEKRPGELWPRMNFGSATTVCEGL